MSCHMYEDSDPIEVFQSTLSIDRPSSDTTTTKRSETKGNKMKRNFRKYSCIVDGIVMPELNDTVGDSGDGDGEAIPLPGDVYIDGVGSAKDRYDRILIM